MLSPELVDELIGCATGDANDDDKSTECFRTSAYSTAGDVFELVGSSIKSIERLRRSGGSIFGLVFGDDDEMFAFVVGVAVAVAVVVVVGVICLIGLVLVSDDDREEWRGLTSGGIEDEICRTGGLGGGDVSGDIAESTDFEMNRLRGDSFADGC